MPRDRLVIPRSGANTPHGLGVNSCEFMRIYICIVLGDFHYASCCACSGDLGSRFTFPTFFILSMKIALGDTFNFGDCLCIANTGG